MVLGGIEVEEGGQGGAAVGGRDRGGAGLKVLAIKGELVGRVVETEVETAKCWWWG